MRLRRIAKTISFVMSVCSSASVEQLGSSRKEFHLIWYLNIFRNSVEDSQISLKFEENNVYFTWKSVDYT